MLLTGNVATAAAAVGIGAAVRPRHIEGISVWAVDLRVTRPMPDPVRFSHHSTTIRGDLRSTSPPV